MHIVHVINCLRGGGAQNLVASLAIHQHLQGHDVRVIVIDQWTTDYERHMEANLLKCGVGVINLGHTRRQGYIGWVRAVARLSAQLKDWSPDIINSHLEMSHAITSLACLLSFRRGRRIATVHNAPETWGHNKVAAFVARTLFWRVLNRFVARVYCSEAARQCEADWTGLWVTIPNGVLPPSAPLQMEEKRESFRRQLGIPSNAFVIVTVGSVRSEKNHDTAIQAIAALCAKSSLPMHYVICGGGGTGHEAVVAAIQQTGLSQQVHLLGLRQDARDILFYSDCYLSASLREGLPLAVLEALFAGLPCVLSAIKPHCDLAQEMPGCVLVDNTPDSLAEALRQIAVQNNNLHELRCQREPRLTDYTIEACVSRYLRFYESLLMML